MRRLLKYTGLLLLALLLVMLVKTLLTQSRQPRVKWEGSLATDTLAVRHMSQAIRFQTITWDHLSDGPLKMSELAKMQDWMKQTWPLFHAQANLKIFSPGSMLFELKGTDPGLRPALFLAHLDVVPVDSSDLKFWKFPPFSGAVDHDTLYGRGAIDDKVVAISMLEAVEKKLASGWKPKRTLWFAFGHDEESGGHKGAHEIATYLKKQGLKAEFIMDEGLGVTEGIVPGIKAPVAIIGLAEKGYVSLILSVKMEGGHSSMPKFETAASLLTKALAKIDKHRFDEEFSPPMKQFMETAAPEMTFGYRFLFSNLWVTSPLVKMVMRGNEKTAASISTTHVTTRIKAGVKDNVVPNYAEAMVNFRILPGESVAGTMEQVRKLLNDPRIEIRKHWDFTEPSPVSETNGFGYDLIRKNISRTFEGVVSVPGQVIAITDCQHYYEVSDHVYRFVPLRINNQNSGGIHGINERIAVKNYMECIRFYGLLFGDL